MAKRLIPRRHAERDIYPVAIGRVTILRIIRAVSFLRHVLPSTAATEKVWSPLPSSQIGFSYSRSRLTIRSTLNRGVSQWRSAGNQWVLYKREREQVTDARKAKSLFRYEN